MAKRIGTPVARRTTSTGGQKNNGRRWPAEQLAAASGRTEAGRRVSFQYNCREKEKVIELPKKLRVRLVSFQTYRDVNCGVLHVQRKIEFVHKKEISSD